jgi:hypothetical protein
MTLPLPRRALLLSLLAGLWGRSRSRPATSQPIHRVPTGGHYRLDAEGRLVLVPRREVPAIISEPQPQPLSVSVTDASHNGEPWSLVIRRWAEGAPAHCRLCSSTCIADRHAEGQPSCAFGVRGTLTVEQARYVGHD